MSRKNNHSDKNASAHFKSNTVVIFMFSRFPSVRLTWWPRRSTTLASSVNASQ